MNSYWCYKSYFLIIVIDCIAIILLYRIGIGSKTLEYKTVNSNTFHICHLEHILMSIQETASLRWYLQVSTTLWNNNNVIYMYPRNLEFIPVMTGFGSVVTGSQNISGNSTC